MRASVHSSPDTYDAELLLHDLTGKQMLRHHKPAHPKLPVPTSPKVTRPFAVIDLI